PVIAYATVQVEATDAREAADKAAELSREGRLAFDQDHETFGDQDSFYVAEGEVDVPSEDDGAVAFLSEYETAHRAPAVLVDVRGGNVEHVTACGEVRVMVLDRDNPSFNEDAVGDRVDDAMMERLVRCSRELIEAHERGLEP
ncbi:MAG: hypothetical protein HYS77_13560, partial [Candidatus Rokubacteria bacterium]|nr:hypothetical protein [Candidatus Rokubacteria bacterium]